jgi:hypothetical protein
LDVLKPTSCAGYVVQSAQCDFDSFHCLPCSKHMPIYVLILSVKLHKNNMEGSNLAKFQPLADLLEQVVGVLWSMATFTTEWVKLCCHPSSQGQQFGIQIFTHMSLESF